VTATLLCILLFYCVFLSFNDVSGLREASGPSVLLKSFTQSLKASFYNATEKSIILIEVDSNSVVGYFYIKTAKNVIIS